MAISKGDAEAEAGRGLATTPPEPVPDIRTGDLVASAGVAVAPVLAGSMREYVGAWGRRIRSGDSGALPIIAGLILIVVIFQVENSKFLSAGNIVNLLAYGSIFVVFGMGETFALLLSEIDLSIGFVAAVGAMIVAELMAHPFYWPWWSAVIVGLGATAVIGVVQGTIITRLHIPSFVVTLAGLLGWEGFLIFITDLDKSAVGGVVTIPPTNVLYGLINKQMSPIVSWIVLAVAVALFAVYTLARDARRRRSGLSAPPRSITLLVVAVVAVAGILLVLVCNTNRGTTFVVLRGMPYFVPFVVVVLIAMTVVCGRTRFGRYIYAIGANPEAARRAGINVTMVRTLGFTLCAFTAGLAGLLYESRLGSMGVDVTGGTLVLLGVAAAVIGGTSLFGGRGKPVGALLGGLVIAAVYEGLDLLGVSAAAEYMAIAVVLVAAATVDTLVRRRSSTSAS
jgi:D-xylose transport system permease protein